jgi:hypothetical protein
VLLPKRKKLVFIPMWYKVEVQCTKTSYIHTMYDDPNQGSFLPYEGYNESKVVDATSEMIVPQSLAKWNVCNCNDNVLKMIDWMSM